MIKVDGRTDPEKLAELLTVATECDELDFKETLDLSDKSDELHFVKDAVAMFNRYPGGYLVIGATNEGEPSDRCEGVDWTQFDGARLTDKVRKYTDAPFTVISAVRELDGHTYCIACFQSPENGLPAPFSKMGQFQSKKDGEQVVVFRPGDIIRRDGAQNRAIEYAQWSEILRQHDAVVRADESKRINALVDQFTAALSERGKTPPLVIGMDESALMTAVIACCEAGDASKLVRFVNKLSLELDRSEEAIANLTTISANAIAYGMDDVAWGAIDTLYNFYLSMNRYGVGAEDKMLAIVIACYEIGAAMVMTSRWDMISPFVNRQSPHSPNYVFASWLRECQVIAVNAGKFGDSGSGMMISNALDHLRHHPSIITDLDLGSESADGGLTDEEETALDLLCSFDFLYCLCVFTVGKGQAGAYPACVAYSQKRINAMVVKIFGSNDAARRMLLPDCTDADIANGLRELYRLISNEAMHSSRFVWGFDSTGIIGPFLEANPAHDNR